MYEKCTMYLYNLFGTPELLCRLKFSCQDYMFRVLNIDWRYG